VVATPWLVPCCTLAQGVGIDVGVGVGSMLTWSSNPEFAANGGRHDTLLEVRPHVTLHTDDDGARLRLDGSAALRGVTSSRGTQPTRVLPEADLNGRLEAVERLFFIEAGLRAVQTADDPFHALPMAGTSFNTISATQAKLGPSIEHSLGTDTRYELRSDNSWSWQDDATRTTAVPGSGYFGRHTAMIEQDPRPLGWRLEAERAETRYREGVVDKLRLDLWRASVEYAVGPDVTAGVRLGRERASLPGIEEGWHRIYGVQAKWQPSPRTTLSLFDENRFFGNAWKLNFGHHGQRVSWNVSLSRTLDTSPQALFDQPGIPAFTAQPIGIYYQRVSVTTSRTAAVTLNGVRNIVTLGAFGMMTEDAAKSGPLATGAGATNNNQRGGSIAWARRLTPLTMSTVSFEWARMTALRTDLSIWDNTIQRTTRLQVHTQAAVGTSVVAGMRYRDLDSSIATFGHEAAVFAALDHRF
jgi:hypothetical protein